MEFSAIIGDRSLVFHAPSPTQAYLRAKRWETEERLQKLYLHTANHHRQVIWDPMNDYGVVGSPPKSWKWWFKQVFYHCFYHPLIPLFLVLQAMWPQCRLPKLSEPTDWLNLYINVLPIVVGLGLASLIVVNTGAPDDKIAFKQSIIIVWACVLLAIVSVLK
jgi:hypothetical protein